MSVVGALTAPAGSIAAVSATQPAGSLLTAIQLAGSVMAVSGTFNAAANQSVSGAVTAPGGSVMATNQVAGSILAVSATQGTTPWLIGSVYGNISGSVAATITNTNINISGSVVAFQATSTNFKSLVQGIQSVGATTAVNPVAVSGLDAGGAQRIISVDAQGVVQVSAVQPAGSILAVSGSFTAPANQSVSGAVTFPAGSIATTVNPAGSITAVSATAPAGSILSITTPAGSTMAVLATQVTSPWIVAPNNSSMFAVPVGSYITLQAPGSIMATSATVLPGSVSGAITAPPGSVAAVRFDNASVITVWKDSSVVALQLAGSILATSATVLPGSVSGAITAPPGSVMATNQVAGSVMAVSAVQPAGSLLTAIQLAGSVMAVSGSFAPAANQSVSGAVTTQAGSIMSVTNPAGSVTTVIATNPAGSITSVTAPAGSTMAVLATQVTSPWIVAPNNTSIVGTFQEETVGGPSIKGIALVWESNTSTSVMSTVSPTNPLRVSGSVSGRVEATQPAGSLLTIIHPAGSITSITMPAGSITAVSATAPAGSIMATNQVAGSIMAVSATAPAGSIMATNQVAGSVMAVAAGSVAAFIVGNASIITVSKDSSVISLQLAGSILATSATVLPGSVSGAITAPPGSVMNVANPAGSVTATTATQSGTRITSVIGVYQEETVGGPSVRGMAIVWQSNANTSVLSTVSPTNPFRVLGSVQGSFSVVGTVPVTQATTPWSVTAPAGSIIATNQVAGSILAVNATQPAGSLLSAIQVAGSIMAVVATQPAGSLLAIATPAGSVQAVRTDNASVITIQQANSIVGTYAEDSAHTSADKGVFTLLVRNDTMASITSNDGDYSPNAVGPVGENIVANAPITKWVSGNASIMTSAGGSVQVIAAGGTSVFTYITGIQYGGFGAQSVVLTISGGLGSTLGRYVVPSGGSQNMAILMNPFKTGENSAVNASIGGSAAITSSVFIGVQGFSSKT